MHERSTYVSSTPFHHSFPATSSLDWTGGTERSSRGESPDRSLRARASKSAGEYQDCAGSPSVCMPDEASLSHSAAGFAPNSMGIASGVSNNPIYDVLVIGAGPAGLAAAVQASSKGLSTVVFEAASLGGPLATKLATEDHREFASGPSIAEFIKRLQQVHDSQTRVLIAREVVRLSSAGPIHSVDLSGGETMYARSIVVASGAEYVRLGVPNDDDFKLKGVHYAATGMEAALCLGEEIVVVGGGNSAGQAAVFLSGTAHHVHLVVRGGSIDSKMSHYLVERILHSPHITVHTETEVETLSGDSALRAVTCRHLPTGNREIYLVDNVFVMIGAIPRTDWLRGQVELDADGFVRTGFAHPQIKDSPYAASRAGVFAVGDVRSNSVKRFAAAMSEGTAVANDLRRYLSVGERIAS